MKHPVLMKTAEDEDAEAVEDLSKQLEENPLAIAPREPNWDLKRDVQERLDLLEKRTQRALLELSLFIRFPVLLQSFPFPSLSFPFVLFPVCRRATEEGRCGTFRDR